MADTALKLLNEGYDYVFCLIDMDRIESIPKEKATYKAVLKDRKYKGIRWIHTFPCTEFWFFLHFLKQGEKKYHTTSNGIEVELRKHMPGYEKTKEYLQKINLYKFFCCYRLLK